MTREKLLGILNPFSLSRLHIFAAVVAAWEQPELFGAELRAAFRSLRRAQ